MDTLRTLLTHGLGFGDAILLVIRVSVGVFFAVSGSHKLFSPSRRQSLRETFAADGVTFVPMMYLVPLAELVGGLGLALGALTVLAALGLVALCIAACALDGLKRIPSMHPIDPADWAGDVLHLPEVLYVVCLLAVLSFGPGAYSLDRLVWG
jgi:putative oxidoreductase